MDSNDYRTPEPQAETASQWVEQNVSGNPVLMQAMKNHAEATEPKPDSRGQAREGWLWVPVEATQAMRDAGYGPITAYGSTAYVSAAAVWRSMIAASPTPDEQRAQADKQPISDATRTSEQELIRRAVDSVRLFDQEPLTLLTVSTRHPQDYVLTNEADGTRWRGTADGKWLDEQRAQAAQEDVERFTLDEIADACCYADVSDSKYESICIGLQEDRRRIVREEIAADKPAQQQRAIRCPEKLKNGGVCPHHNLQCGWPQCNEEQA